MQLIAAICCCLLFLSTLMSAHSLYPATVIWHAHSPPDRITIVLILQCFIILCSQHWKYCTKGLHFSAFITVLTMESLERNGFGWGVGGGNGGYMFFVCDWCWTGKQLLANAMLCAHSIPVWGGFFSHWIKGFLHNAFLRSCNCWPCTVNLISSDTKILLWMEGSGGHRLWNHGGFYLLFNQDEPKELLASLWYQVATSATDLIGGLRAYQNAMQLLEV